nr:E3 ubiquitin-protein ligase UPL1-like [Tanacetum cinerariifolium]
MVNTRTDANLSAAVQNALQTLLPQICEEIREEFRTGFGSSNAGGNPSPVSIHTWLECVNKQKPHSFKKATVPVDAKNWISHMEKIFDVMGCEDAFKTRLAVYKFEGNALAWWKAYKQAKGGDAKPFIGYIFPKEHSFISFFPVDHDDRNDAKNPDLERGRAGGGHLVKSGRSGVFIQAMVEKKKETKRAVQVPPRIKSFIDGVVATPLEKIQEPLKSFVWEFEKGDFHHWLDLFNHFDMYFEKYIKPRKDLQLEDDFLEHDPPFPREAVLQILRVVRIILENCTNKHFYSSYEHHLSSLLASTDVDVVEACLQTLTAFLKSVGKHVIKDASLSSKLFAFAQGWGGKEEGNGLVACAIENGSDPIAHELGNTLHFEFYVDNDNQGLQIIHLPEVNTCQQSDLELMQRLVLEYKVPVHFRFSLLTRLRFARAFGSYSARLQYTCIRLHAFMFLVQACSGKTDDAVAFFDTEPEFINELVTLLSYEDAVPERVRILCLLSLVAVCQDHKTAVLAAVTSGAQCGILSSLAQKAIDAVASKSSEWSVSFAEALVSLVTVVVSSSAGCSAMCATGFIPTLLPLLKDTDPQHMHLVSTAVHVLEAFMDYSNPAAVLFRDLGGLDDAIVRLKIEVSHIENGTSSDALVSHHRRSLVKALLRAISLGAYGLGAGSHVYGSEGSLLPYCLCVIFKKAHDFKGGVFSLAANLMSDLIQQDPTCYPSLEAAGIPSAFLNSINDGVICSAEAITCIPQCLDALCLNNSGLQAVRDRNALSCLVNIFTNKTYVRVLGDSASSLSSGLDEMMRHSSSLREHVMDVLIEILKAIEKLGHGDEVAAVPMETNAENQDSGKLPELSVDTSLLNVCSFLPDCVNNAAHLLDNVLQNSDTCRVFIEKKGLEAVLQLFTLSLMPSSVSIGQSLAVAFKAFSSQHSASLARALCSFMREHVKSTNELLISLQGTQLVNVENAKRTKVLRCLSSLEGILLSLSTLTKANSNLVSELGASDADVLNYLGATLREILWQQSLYSDPKINEKQSVETMPENVNATVAGAGDVDDVAIPGLRVPARNSSHTHALEDDFPSILRSGEVFSQRSRNRLSRSRGGRTGRHLIDSDFLMDNSETTSQDLKSKSPEILVMENLNKLASTLRSFFTSLLKGFASTNHRRGGSLSAALKSIGTALAKVFFEALGFSGYTLHAGIDTMTLKCRYLGKVVDHMGGLISDSRRSSVHTVMINNLYVQGTFKELLNTFEATSQLLWTLSGVDHEKGEGSRLYHSSWLLKTLDSYCHVLEYFVNSGCLLSPASTSQANLVLQPAAVGLSIGLFPVPTEPKVFVRMLQSQVLDIILPVWNHPMFSSCNAGFVSKIVTLLNYVCCGASDAKLSYGGGSGGTANQRVSAARVPNESTIATIVEMGFTRRRAEEALRNIGTNSVEMATEWLFTHPEDHVEEDDEEMTEALALSLGDTEKSEDAETGNVEKAPHIDDILSGEDRKKVIAYLIQQLKLCPLETISHTLALLLNEDVTTREIAAENGIVSVAIDILANSNLRTKSGNEMPAPKCISALLLILDSLLHSSPKRISDSIEETKTGSLPLPPQELAGKISEKSSGYLTIEEGKRVLDIISDMIKQNVPGMVMQAALLLCARLTKTHTLALHFLEIGGMDALFSIPETSFFLVYETVTSAIIRHLIEDPQTLQTAMELEIRQTVSAPRSAGRILPQAFLKSMAPLISRDPAIFMKAVTEVCQLESSGGSTYVVLSKEKVKEKDKSKVSGVEIGLPENKVKCLKKIPTNLLDVIHHMLDTIIENPSLDFDEECTTSSNAMEVDEPSTSKGKSKVIGTGKESDNLPVRLVRIARVTFVLKLLSDILLMYVHAAGIVLKRDLEMCHYPGSNGIIHHIVHQFLYPRDESRAKLSEKASWFLVVLCGRSSEGRRRVINELGKVLFSFSSSASNSSQGNLLPDKKVVAFVDLAYSVLSKNSSSGNITGSSDVAKGMIDGGLIPCLSSILRVLDLDHPDAFKVVNIILMVLESLTRAAIAPEQLSLSDSAKKKNAESSGTGSDNQTADPNRTSQHDVTVTEGTHQQTPHEESDSHSNLNQPAVQEMGVDMDETETVGFMHGEMEDSGQLHNSDQIEMAFHVDDRGGDNTGDEDDDMGDDDDDNDEDGDNEDDDIAEDGPTLMSLADTDVEDHDEAELRDEYDNDMVDEEDDDYHENRVIEVRWRESVDRLDHIQVHGQLGIARGLIGMAAESLERVNAHNLFGVGRSLGSDRRRQQNGTSIETSGTEGNGLQHPLLSRPSQSGDLGSIRSSRGTSYRNLESLSGGYVAPVLPHDHVHSGVPPTPLGDNSVGMESMYTSGRRGLGDSRWTDGQPQAGGQAAAIAQTVEEQFLSQLRTAAQSSSPIIQSNSASLVNQSDAPVADNTQLVAGLDSSSQQSEDHHVEIDQNAMHLPPNQIGEGDINPQQAHSSVVVEQTGEDLQAHGTSSDLMPSSTCQDNMETGEGDGNVNEQEMCGDRLSATANVTERNENADPLQSSEQNTQFAQDNSQIAQSDETGAASVAPNENGIDPTFLEALPEDLRAEVLASQQARSTPALAVSSVAEDIDPEFLAALPPDIQAEVLAQQRAQRVVQQAEGQPVDMDNASIIATFSADLRHEVLLTSSESVLSALPSSLLAEAQMLRDRAMSHYHARSLVGSNHRVFTGRTGAEFDRQTVISECLKGIEVDGEPLLDADGLKGLVRLLRLAQPLAKGLLQRLFLNLSAHGCTREIIVNMLLNMIKPETEGPVGRLTKRNSQRLYGCQSNVVYGRSQLIDGLPPQVLLQILEILNYLATNHSCVADILFYFNSTRGLESLNTGIYDMNDKGKGKVLEGEEIPQPDGLSMECDVPILLFTKLLNHRNTDHLEQVLGLLHVVVYNAASKLDCNSPTEPAVTNSEDIPSNEAAGHPQEDSSVGGTESDSVNKNINNGLSASTDQKSVMMNDIFLKLPQAALQNLCSLLGHEGLSDKVYTLTGELLKKLASIAPSHRKFFIVELSDLARSLSSKAVQELITLRNTQMLGLSTGSMAGSSVLRILQTLNSLTLVDGNKSKGAESDGNQEHVTMWKLHVSLEPLWQELSECIGVTESQLGQGSLSSVVNANVGDPPLPLGTRRLLPFIEAFLVLCDKLQENRSLLQQDNVCATESKIKQSITSSSQSQTTEGTVTFTRFAEKHRRLLNAFVRQDPVLLEKSLSMLLKVPKLMDFDNKRSYFRSRIRKQHEQLLAGPLRVTVRRAYVLEDSYNQLRMRSIQDMKGRLNVHFRGEEGIDAGGLTREWYQLLSRVIFDKGALLFTTGGNNATFQPNPNSVYQTEHLSYFKFVGRVVAKALFDGQLLDVYFTRSFYKHILGVKVTYHDIEAVDPDYYKNLKWMLENDVSDIPDLTFSMDADEEKHILYEKTEVSDYELKPGGGNIRVTEETKHEYVDLVADHKLTNAIRPQINSFLEGFGELIPRELITMFNDKELELLISGLPEINLNDLQANTEYSGYTAVSNAVTWFWEVVKAFNKEDRARLLQFVTGTSKVPLEGFKALQGISGPQRFQIHKAYGAPERLPSAHTCFNQLDLPEYKSKEQLQERLLLAIHEGSEEAVDIYDVQLDTKWSLIILRDEKKTGDKQDSRTTADLGFKNATSFVKQPHCRKWFCCIQGPLVES